MLTQAELDEKKRQLQQMRINLEQQIASVRSRFGEPERTFIPTDLADEATELFEKTKTEALVRTMQDTVYRIDRALERIEQGTYGWCANCNEEIPKERLDVLPYADSCVTCQDKDARGNARSGRELRVE